MDGTVWCDQSKYIQHCLRENGFYNQERKVVLRKAHAPPTIDERLGEEEGSVKDNINAMAVCRNTLVK